MKANRTDIARRIAVTSAALLGTALTPLSALAQSADWNGATGDYTTSGNWTPSIVPSARARFGATGVDTVTIAANATIEQIEFTANAQQYSITNLNGRSFTVNGSGTLGITNLSGFTQSIVNLGTMTFNNGATIVGGTAGLFLDNGDLPNGSFASMIFNGTSGIDVNVILTSIGGNVTATGTAESGGGAVLAFNDDSSADGATISAVGGAAQVLATAGNPATGVGGSSLVTFSDNAHADGAFVINNGGIAFSSAANGTSSLAVGGIAVMSFADDSHADGATFFNQSGGASAGGAVNGGVATALSGNATLTFSGNAHADNAIFNNQTLGATGLGGSGTAGGAVDGDAGGAGSAAEGSAVISLTENAHANGATFNNFVGQANAVGGAGGVGGTTGAGGAGGTGAASGGTTTLVVGGNAQVNGATITNDGLLALASGGVGGASGTGNGGAGGAAAASGGTVNGNFSSTAPMNDVTIVNAAGDAFAVGGAGGTGTGSGTGGAGGNASVVGGSANMVFSGTASLGTGSTLVNAGGTGSAFGGAGGSGGNGNGGAGGAASATGGNASIAFVDSASAGNAMIVNQAGNASSLGGNGGSGSTGNGGNGGSATSFGGNALISFNGSSTAGSATIQNIQNGTLSLALGDIGADGLGGGLGGNSGGASGTRATANIIFYDNATGGTAQIQNMGGGLTFYDNSVFGTGPSGGTVALIENSNQGQVVFAGSSSLGNGMILNNTGPATNVSFGDSASAGSGTIVNNGGNVIFSDSATAGSATLTNNDGFMTFAGSSSAGTALITNADLLNFIQSSDAVAARVVNSASGTVSIGVNAFRLGSLSGAGTVNNNGNTIQIGYLDLNDTFSGVISGAGGLIKRGTGTLVLTGENTYAGGTTIAEGTLQIGDGGTTGSVMGDITNNGALVFDRSNSLIYGDVISGSGTVTKNGAGTLVLTGENTYAGVTTVNQGTLQIGLIGTTGSIASDVVLNNDSRIAFSRTDDFTYAGAISGTGSMVKVGAGTLTFTGANSYTGGTAIAGGTLQIGNGGTTGSIAGDIAVGGTSVLAFNRSDTIAYGGNISGNGQLTKLGAGTLILTGDVAHAGGTTVQNGTVQLGDGGTTGSLAGDVNLVNLNSVLAFNRSDTVTFGGVVSGLGALSKIGSGTLVLTGANTYTGGTFVNAGTLQLNGSVASLVSVGAAGRFTGTGTVNGGLVANGVVAPGTATAPLGTLTVTGNAAFNAGSILAPTITSAGQTSLLQAGSLTINAGTVRPVAVPGGLFLMQTDYRVAAGTGGRTGTFGGVDESQLPTFLDASLFYTANEVFLRVRRNATNFAQVAGLTPNQDALSDALDAAVVAGDADVFGTYLTTYNTLLALGTNGPLQTALDTLSGDALTAVPAAAQEHSNRFSHRLAANTWSNSSNVWGLIAYGDQSADGDGNGPGFDADGLEFQVGFNTSLGANTRLGLSAGYNEGNVDVDGRAASANVDSWSIGAHLRHDFGPVYASGQLTYSWHSVDTRRALLLGGFANADFDASTWTAAGEIGGMFRAGQLSIEPHVSIRHASTEQDAYAETGPVGALNVAAADFETTRFGLGVRLANRDPQAPVRFHALLRYEHETGDEQVVLDNTLPGLPTFRLLGTRLGDDILTADVGVEFQVSQGLSVFAAGGGHIRSNDTSLNASAGLRFRF
ncbi:MAG TPA: autotransporter domain-containing protein [Allosphingosinicella sp.]|nr:autotransporter domain-containing protein [Allosphingosinicella sp.]